MPKLRGLPLHSPSAAPELVFARPPADEPEQSCRDQQTCAANSEYLGYRIEDAPRSHGLGSLRGFGKRHPVGRIGRVDAVNYPAAAIDFRDFPIFAELAAPDEPRAAPRLSDLRLTEDEYPSPVFRSGADLARAHSISSAYEDERRQTRGALRVRSGDVFPRHAEGIKMGRSLGTARGCCEQRGKLTGFMLLLARVRRGAAQSIRRAQSPRYAALAFSARPQSDSSLLGQCCIRCCDAN